MVKHITYSLISSAKPPYAAEPVQMRKPVQSLSQVSQLGKGKIDTGMSDMARRAPELGKGYPELSVNPSEKV